MSHRPTCEIKGLGHLGLISSIFIEMGLTDYISKLLPKKSHNQFITHGEAIFAMVLQGLGFGNRRPYLADEFFSHLDLERLFARKVKAAHINGDVLGRALDAIYSYGATRFFTDITLYILLKMNPKIQFAQLDTTTYCVHGRKYKRIGDFEFTHGYSKDKRADLKQIVHLLITTDEGTPLYTKAHSGNASDKETFQEAIKDFRETFHHYLQDTVLVVDSALYSKKFLQRRIVSGEWITRVPESIRMCRDEVTRKYERLLWTKLDDDFKYMEIENSYGGIKQRWIMVRSRRAKYKEIATLHKRIKHQEELLCKRIDKLNKKVFYSKQGIAEELEKLQISYPLFKVRSRPKRYFEPRGRRQRQVMIGYTAHLSTRRDLTKISKAEEKKGKFILATNCLDREKLSAKDVIAAYQARNGGVESSFKFFKDKTYKLNQMFLKKESRIEAMLSVMALTLLANNLAQQKIREHLNSSASFVTDQLGRPTRRPTFKWISYLMRQIQVVKIKFQNVISDEIKGIRKEYESIIRAFGDYAQKIYDLA